MCDEKGFYIKHQLTYKDGVLFEYQGQTALCRELNALSTELAKTKAELEEANKLIDITFTNLLKNSKARKDKPT